MSPEFRGGLTVAAVAGAFMAGYFLKPTPAIPTVVAQAPVPAPAPAPAAGVPLVLTPVDDPKKPAGVSSPSDWTPRLLIPPLDEQVKPAATDVNPNDPALKMIGDALGIKTTSVLAEVEKTAGGSKEPIPMGGPMPRLEPPPMPPTPLVDELPVQRPAPCGTIRITIRDQNGHVTTMNTAERITIEVAPLDGKPAGSEVGPMPREVESVSEDRPRRRYGTFVSIGLNRADDLDAEDADAARDWIQQVTDTDVLRANDTVLPATTRQADPFVPPTGCDFEPAAMDLLVFRTIEGEQGSQVFTPLRIRSKGFGDTQTYRNHLELGAKASAVCSGGRSLMHLLGDSDWKPSAAAPDLTRWVVDPPTASPFEGVTDIVPPPSSTLARRVR